MADEKKIWFPAKRYGWGWGLPCAWQGWVVFLAFLASPIAAAILINPVTHLGLFLAVMYGLIMAFILICWWKGEKTAWRWGDKK